MKTVGWQLPSLMFLTLTPPQQNSIPLELGNHPLELSPCRFFGIESHKRHYLSPRLGEMNHQFLFSATIKHLTQSAGECLAFCGDD